MKKQFIASILLAMKITTIQIALATFFSFSVSAGELFGQAMLDKEISISVTDEKLSKIISKLQKQTGVTFLYSPEKIGSNRKITVNATGKKLGAFLNEILISHRIGHKVINDKIVLFPGSSEMVATSELETTYSNHKPDRIITGVVTNEKGEPVSNATIIVKGTNLGTETDENGLFRVDVPQDNAVLIISYTGYDSQEIAIEGRTQINVSLQLSNNTLNDVVVVGYGTQRQRNVTGAIASVGTREIKSVAVTGFDQALQGRMAGVQVTQNSGEPGGSVSIRIRGVGSINSSSEPLYVVDGIPLTGSINSINPNDIERIDVLKDASSAAIYGSRGSNGVVLITTKRGKQGKLQVSFDGYVGTQRPTKKIELLNGPQFAKLANENLVNGGMDPNPRWSNPESMPTYDWQEEIFQTSPIQSYNVSMSGGGDRSRSFFSVGFFQQGGIIIGSDYKRYTSRFNTDYDISDRIKVGATINLAYAQKSSVSTDNDFAGVLVNASQLQPTTPIYNATDGLDADNIFFGWNGYNFTSKFAPVNYYPTGLNNEVYIYKERYITSPNNNFQIMTSAFAEAEVIKGLKLRSNINVGFGSSIGQYILKDAPDEIATTGQYRSPSSYGENMGRYLQWNWINTATYSKAFGAHNVSVVVGSDALKENSNGLGANGVGNIEGQNSINATDNIAGRRATGSPSDFSLVSYFARVTYDFDGKYLLTANIRRDGSSKFGPNRKYGNFPSASIGWRISQEDFMRDVTSVDELKIRASYGTVGNQNIPNFKYLSTFTNDAGTYQYVLGPGQVPVIGMYANNIGDANIHWEKATQMNIGVDASFLNNKFTFTGDYYIKNISDLLGYYPLPSYMGVNGNSVLINSFSMENRGLELSLGYNETFGDFRFSANINFSSLDNKVTELTGDEKSYVSQSISTGRDDNAQTRSQVGERIANFWGYVSDGIFQTDAEAAESGMGGVFAGDRRFKDLNKDGVVDANDKTILGNGLPKYIYGINLRGDFKNFDLTLFLTGQADVEIANMTKFFLTNMRYYNSTGITNGSVDLLDSWAPDNKSNVMPRNSYTAPASNRYFSTYYIENGAFLRIRNLQLGYTLPTRISSKIRSSSARIYFAAQNLYTFTNYSGYDPEVGSSARGGAQNPLTAGVDFGRYPVPRTFMAGVNFQF